MVVRLNKVRFNFSSVYDKVRKEQMKGFDLVVTYHTSLNRTDVDELYLFHTDKEIKETFSITFCRS